MIRTSRTLRRACVVVAAATVTLGLPVGMSAGNALVGGATPSLTWDDCANTQFATYYDGTDNGQDPVAPGNSRGNECDDAVAGRDGARSDDHLHRGQLAVRG